MCNAVVDPTPFINNCGFDFSLCNATDREACYCDSLATYAAACAAAGVPPSNWRRSYCRKCMCNCACSSTIYVLYLCDVHIEKLSTDSKIFCFLTAIQCPPGMIFQQCGSLCPQTCESSTSCNGGCAEGCFCPDGQVINSNGLCTDPRDCLGKKFE